MINSYSLYSQIKQYQITKRMWLKLYLYSCIISWGALALFAYRNVKKTLKKYRNIKEVEDTYNWQGTKRLDFNKWDEKAIIRGCFIRFPFKFILMLTELIIFIITALSQTFLRKIHKNLDKIIMRQLAFSALSFIYEITQDKPLPEFNTPIMISNHVNWFDIVYHCVRLFPISFISKAEMKRVPILGRVAKKIQCIFLERESEESRNVTLQKIESQINAFNKDSHNNNPFIIFPEGTTSNGQSILRFKIGAFNNKSKITIVSFNYSCQGFDMGMDEINPVEHFIISFCLSAKLHVKFKQMQPSQSEAPEQYMVRCQRELSNMTGYPIYDSGFTQKIKLKQARFGKKQA